MPETTTKLRGLVMSGENVAKTLAGAKTQTRRILKPQPQCKDLCWDAVGNIYDGCSAVPGKSDVVGILRHRVPDRLYLKESWRLRGWDEDDDLVLIEYADATLSEWIEPGDEGNYFIRNLSDGYEGDLRLLPWESPLFMPAWASRAKIEIVAIEVERVQDISEEDCIAEGMDGRYMIGGGGFGSKYRVPVREQFRQKWLEINGPQWESNPWVAAYTYKLVKETK